MSLKKCPPNRNQTTTGAILKREIVEGEKFYFLHYVFPPCLRFCFCKEHVLFMSILSHFEKETYSPRRPN
jgi:hypothetical protein